MKRFLQFLPALFIHFAGQAQGGNMPDTVTATLQPPQGIRWVRAFGGSAQDVAMDVMIMPDSGFIVVGTNASNDFDFAGSNSTRDDGFIARFDKNGHLLWNKIYLGPSVD